MTQFEGAIRSAILVLKQGVSPSYWGTVYLEVDFKSGGVVHVEAYQRPKWDVREVTTAHPSVS